MSDKTFANAAQRNQLPKLTDDGQNNNYSEWETKAYHILCSWDLWKYIEGPTSEAPNVPALRELQTFHGVDNNGNVLSIRDLGNKEEHEQAIKNAQPWMDGNNLCLSKIVTTVPSPQIHLVKCV